jgi:hypothetical protein
MKIKEEELEKLRNKLSAYEYAVLATTYIPMPNGTVDVSIPEFRGVNGACQINTRSHYYYDHAIHNKRRYSAELDNPEPSIRLLQYSLDGITQFWVRSDRNFTNLAKTTDRFYAYDVSPQESLSKDLNVEWVESYVSIAQLFGIISFFWNETLTVDNCYDVLFGILNEHMGTIKTIDGRLVSASHEFWKEGLIFYSSDKDKSIDHIQIDKDLILRKCSDKEMTRLINMLLMIAEVYNAIKEYEGAKEETPVLKESGDAITEIFPERAPKPNREFQLDLVLHRKNRKDHHTNNQTKED